MESKKLKLNYVIQVIIQYSVIGYAAVLPLGFAIANILLGIWAVLLIASSVSCKELLTFDKFSKKWIFWFGIVFFIYLATLLYSKSISEGFSEIVKKIPILFITLYLLIFRRLISKKIFTYSLISYLFSIIFVSIATLVFAYFQCSINDGINCFTGQNLASAFISYHKLYFSLYATVGVLCAIVLLYESIGLNNKWRLLLLLCLIYLFSFLNLLEGRSSIAIAAFLILAYLVIEVLRQRRTKLLLFGTIFITSIIGSNIIFNPTYKEKFKELINYNNEYNIKKKWGGTSVRKLIWEYSLIVVAENPILGVGVGDVQEELNKSYSTCEESSALDGHNYNAHNQYIQIAVTSGLLGLFLYLIAICLIGQNFIHNRNIWGLMCLFLFLVSGLSESILERDMGIRISTFFLLIFFINNSKNNEGSTDT